MNFGLPEILIIVLIVLLLFGPGRIQKIFTEMGKGIKSFKDGLQGNKDEKVEEEDKKEPPVEKK
jgi:sec-independent protein translocase protein TatA